MNGSTLIRNPGIESLLEVLHQERRILERLLYRLSEAKLLVISGHDRYLAMASDDAGAIESELGEVEMLRAILVAGLAERWDVPDTELTLRRITQRAEPRYVEMLAVALDELSSLTTDIEGLKELITKSANEQLQLAKTAIRRLSDGPADVYRRDGSPSSTEDDWGFEADL